MAQARPGRVAAARAAEGDADADGGATGTVAGEAGEGAEAYGFVGEVWTTKRAARVIKQEFGVQYHPAHVSRLLRALGWTVQKLIRRASQRDDAATTTWRD